MRIRNLNFHGCRGMVSKISSGFQDNAKYDTMPDLIAEHGRNPAQTISDGLTLYRGESVNNLVFHTISVSHGWFSTRTRTI